MLEHETNVDGTKVRFKKQGHFIELTFETPYSSYLIFINQKDWFRFYRLMDGFNHALERHELK